MPTGIYLHKIGQGGRKGRSGIYPHKYHGKGFQKNNKIGNRFQKGEKNLNWKGGISFKSYSINWTDDLKRAIRKRDHYTCRLCGKEPAISCHHIDYDKKNCNPNNLITLCISCNSKVNKNRKYWIKYFKSRMK